MELLMPRFGVRGLLGVCLALALALLPSEVRAQQDAGGGVDIVLAEARRTFEALDYERAVTALDRAVSLLEGRPMDGSVRAQLVEAFELRARARFGMNDREGALADFRSLLALSPGHAFAGQISPTVVAAFNELKKSVIGTINVRVTPADAQVEIDGVPTPSTQASIAILAGPHTIAARRPGYRPAAETITVTAGAAADMALTLERVSATISVFTVPAEVEVIVDGVARGTTAPGPPPAEYADYLKPLGVPLASTSQPFVIADITPGTHVIQLRKDCYVASEERVQVEKPADYRLPPVRLPRAVGTVSIEAAEGTVFIDGETRGAPPVTVDDLCEGPHVIEVRSAVGRHVRRVDIRTGEKVVITPNVRPAVALLSTAGLAEEIRGGSDLRLAIERVFESARTATVFAPPADAVNQVLAREKLTPGWLSFDTARRPIGSAAANITEAARRDLSARIAKALGVQAVAVITAASKEARSDVYLTLLAAGSGMPDTLRVNLDDPESVRRALERFDSPTSLVKPSAGMLAIDILDVQGAVVVSVDPGGPASRARLNPGDIITKVNGQPVTDTTAFAAAVSRAKEGEMLTLEVRDKADATWRADLGLASVPQLIAMLDETLLSNKLLLDFRSEVGSLSGHESVARLNLAVALMRVGNWSEARSELEKVRLPNGTGVSNGTVLYLMAMCHDALGQRSEAEAALRGAAATSATLTNDGPSIKLLAEAKLAEIAQRGRKP
jgi:hypothetical protein